MELPAALLALYLLQCVRRLPPGSVLFLRVLRGWRCHPAGGWRLLFPLPSSTSLVGCRVPLVEREGELRGRGAVTWLSGGVPVGLAPFDASSPSQISARGDVVRVGGRPFAQGVDAAHAAELAAWLGQLASAGAGSERRRLLEAAISESLRWERLRERLRRVQEETGWVRASADTYAVALFAVLPVLVAWLGAEATLLRAAIPLTVLHLLGLIAFALAQRRLDPAGSGDRAAALIAMSLYPPLLLRGYSALTTDALTRYHPVAVAAAVLEGPELRAFLRRELVRARAGAAASEIASLEAAAIEAVVEGLGESSRDLLAPPVPSDPLVESYCPACHEGYRCRGGLCRDCGVALRPLDRTA